jgi:hypothetical protein
MPAATMIFFLFTAHTFCYKAHGDATERFNEYDWCISVYEKRKQNYSRHIRRDDTTSWGWEDNIKIVLKEMRYEDVNWIQMAQDGDQQWAPR